MSSISLAFTRTLQLIAHYKNLYLELAKFRLSSLVVFSSGITYLLALNRAFDPLSFAMFILGALAITAAANTLNQIYEKDKDVKMNRTKGRPLPTERISIGHAGAYALVLIALGSFLLLQFTNTLTFSLSLGSLVLYAFVYTPLKSVTPLAVAVGAIPGALPPLIGWVAVSNAFTMEALILFGIQFIWQFPHFWSIAWILDDDYKKAGFRLLPTKEGRNLKTAFQIMIYTLLLIPLGMLPYLFGMTGKISSYVILVCGVLFFAQTIYLMKECSNKEAKKLMFASILYLPIVQLSLLLDKA